MKPKLTSTAVLTIIVLSSVLAVGNYVVVQGGLLGQVGLGSLGNLAGEDSSVALVYLTGAPIVVGLLLLLIVPRCVALEGTAQEVAEGRPPAPEQPQKSLLSTGPLRMRPSSFWRSCSAKGGWLTSCVKISARMTIPRSALRCGRFMRRVEKC